MNTSNNSKTRIEKLIFNSKIEVHLNSGDVLVIPYDYTKKLSLSTKEQLKQYRLIAAGIGVHFEEIDEDISLLGIIQYKATHELVAS